MSTAKQLLRVLYEKTGIVDNGTCAICHAARYWTLAGSNAPAAPCENPSCISHEIEKVLNQKAKAQT